jgi:hypothetical protein
MHAMYLSVTGELEFPIPWPSRRVGVRKEHRHERHHRLGLNPATPTQTRKEHRHERHHRLGLNPATPNPRADQEGAPP